MKKKAVAMFLALTMATGLLAGCGGSSDSATTGSADQAADASSGGEKQTLSIWLPPYGDEDLSDKDFWTEELAEVAAQYNLELDIEVVPWDNYEEKFLTGISSGTGPDIGYMYNEMVMGYIEKGQLEPLEAYFSEEDTADYIYYDQGQVNGTQYMLPFLVGNPRIIYCNLDLFEQAGIEELPTTWEELKECAKTITEATGVQGYQQYWGGYFGDLDELLLPYIWQAGGSWYDEAGNLTLDTPEVLKAIEYIQSLKEEGVITDSATSMDGSAVMDEFKAGNLAMADGSTSSATGIDSAGINWGFTVLQDETYGTFIANDSLVMMSSCENKEAAAAVMKAMTSPSVMEDFHTKMYAMPPINKSETYCDNEKFESFYEEYSQYFHSLPIVSDSSNMYTQLHSNMQLMLMGELTPQQVIDETIAYVQQ
ncbi:MAG: sugar ABC transporter substrate-binding protein [Eubacteriales bacterium]|nr:sugar ABC transporter substrate-binding protein [Eubacteriales bacterium]